MDERNVRSEWYSSYFYFRSFCEGRKFQVLFPYIFEQLLLDNILKFLNCLNFIEIFPLQNDRFFNLSMQHVAGLTYFYLQKYCILLFVPF